MAAAEDMDIDSDDEVVLLAPPQKVPEDAKGRRRGRRRGRQQKGDEMPRDEMPGDGKFVVQLGGINVSDPESGRTHTEGRPLTLIPG